MNNNYIPEKETGGKTSFQSTRIGGGEQSLPQDCRGKAAVKGVFFADTGNGRNTTSQSLIYCVFVNDHLYALMFECFHCGGHPVLARGGGRGLTSSLGVFCHANKQTNKQANTPFVLFVLYVHVFLSQGGLSQGCKVPF